VYKRQYLDECLREILPCLDDYVVIITSDHGDLLGEYGKFSHPGLRVPELVHVPLLIRLPGYTPKKMPMLYTHYQLFEFIKYLTRNRK